MPAITVEDILSLPKIAQPDPTVSIERPVATVTTAPAGFEGEGFPVRRAFAGVDSARIDPFIHLDQMGQVHYAPGEPKGTSWHPHRGFETVTYMIDGTFQHRDTTGGGGLITNGDTQWMTAGSGILHIERPPEELVVAGGLFHGLQLWVNLPAAKKWNDPRYQDIRAERVTLLASPDGGVLLRLIAGTIEAPDSEGGVTRYEGPGVTQTPITMIHATLAPGAQLRLPWRRDFNALAYVLSGAGTVGPERHPVRTGQLAVFGPSAAGDEAGAGGLADTITIEVASRGDSHTPELDVLLLGGAPIGEPVAWYGPFVMNTRDELIQAFEDFQRGRMGQIPATDAR